MILLILAIQRAHFVILLMAFSWVVFYRTFLSGSVLSSTLDFSCTFYRAFLLSGSLLSSRAALPSENACHQFLCR